MLYFNTPSHFDIRSLQVMGLSSKPSEDAIGRFGTGLKYAIAIISRLGGKIEFYSCGARTARISVKRDNFRGKAHDFITFQPESGAAIPLPFTTQLGQDWEPWMAYRELASNTRDESGSIDTAPASTFSIGVECPEVEIAHHQQVFIAPTSPIYADANFEVHPFSTAYHYVKGIRAGNQTSPLPFTINFLQAQIGEDRTLNYPHHYENQLYRRLVQSNCEALFPHLAFAQAGSMWADGEANFTLIESHPFFAYLKNLLNEGRTVCPRAYALFRLNNRGEIRSARTVSARDSQILLRAIDRVNRLGYPVTTEQIKFVPRLEGAWGMVENKTIYLIDDLLTSRSDQLFKTLLEECVHLYEDAPDCSRAMQEILLSIIDRKA